MPDTGRKIRMKTWIVVVTIFLFLPQLAVFGKELIIRKGSEEVIVVITEDGMLVSNKDIVTGNSATSVDLVFHKSGDNKLVLSEDGIKVKGTFHYYQTSFSNGLKFNNKSKPVADETQAAVCENDDFEIRGLKFEQEILPEPNFVRTYLYQKPDANGEIILTRYTDGAGRNIQNQLKIPGYKTLLSGTYYDKLNRPVEMNKPYPRLGALHYYRMFSGIGNYKKSLLLGAGGYFGDSYAYTEMNYSEDPLSRTHAIGLPGTDYSLAGNHAMVWHFGVPSSGLAGFLDADLFLIPQKLNETDLNPGGAFPNALQGVACDNYLIVQKDPNDNFTQRIVDKKGNVIRTWAYALPNEDDYYSDPTPDDLKKIIVAQYYYDIMDNVLSEEPPDVEASSQNSNVGSTHYGYNTMNQPVSKINADIGLVEYTYDHAGRLATLTKANGVVLIFTYDDLGRLKKIKEDSPVNLERIFKYYDNTEEIGINFSHVPEISAILADLKNLRGRPVGDVSVADNYDNVVDLYSYKDDGRYDATYKYIPHVGWTKITYEYTLQGDLKTKQVMPHYVPGQTPDPVVFDYEYDMLGRLGAVKDEYDNDLVTYTYNNIGQLEQKGFYKNNSDVATVDYTYNIRDWINSIYAKNRDGATEFCEDLGYTGQYNGNITSADYYYRQIQTSDKTVDLAYDYDGVNRLTNVAGAGEHINYSENFAYDNVGRIESTWRHGDPSDNLYCYKPLTNQLDSVSNKQSAHNYAYDPSGNMIQDNSKDMNVAWDWRDMATKFSMRGGTGSDGAEVDMLYDASGNRVLKIDQRLAPPIKAVAYVGDELVYETDDIDNDPFEVTDAYIPGASGTEGKIDYTENEDGTAYFFLQDHLGTTRAIFADNSDLVKADMYFAYGSKNPIVASLTNRKDFTGKEFDEDGADDNDENGMGLYYFGKRYFDPEICRWISTDPQEQFFDLYNYCGGNSIINIDATGGISYGAAKGLGKLVPGRDINDPYLAGVINRLTSERIKLAKDNEENITDHEAQDISIGVIVETGFLEAAGLLAMFNKMVELEEKEKNGTINEKEMKKLKKLKEKLKAKSMELEKKSKADKSEREKAKMDKQKTGWMEALRKLFIPEPPPPDQTLNGYDRNDTEDDGTRYVQESSEDDIVPAANSKGP